MESNATVEQLPLSDRLHAWFEVNKLLVIRASAIVLIVGIIVGFFIWRSAEKETAAGQALASVGVSMAVTGPRPDLADAYLKVAAAHPDTKAGVRALLLAAGNLFTAGKYPEAQVQFEKFTKEPLAGEFQTEGFMGIAACQEAQGKIDAAITSYKNIADRYPTATVAPQAKFALARLYESQNKVEQAYGLFRDVAQTVRYGSLGDEAAMRMRDLEIKNPSLAKPVMAPATTTTIQPAVTPATPAPAPAPAKPAAQPVTK